MGGLPVVVEECPYHGVNHPIDPVGGVCRGVALRATRVERLLGATIVRIVVGCLAALVLVTHRVAGAALGSKYWLVRHLLVAFLQLLAALVAEPLHIDSITQQIIEGEHVRQRGASPVKPVCNLIEAWSTLFVIPLATTFVAERPNDNRGVISVSLYHSTHVDDVFGLVREQPVLIHHHDAEPVVDIQHRSLWRVVRSAASIAAHGPGRLSTKEVDALGYGHANHRERVVVAETPHLA